MSANGDGPGRQIQEKLHGSVVSEILCTIAMGREIGPNPAHVLVERVACLHRPPVRSLVVLAAPIGSLFVLNFAPSSLHEGADCVRIHVLTDITCQARCISDRLRATLRE